MISTKGTFYGTPPLQTKTKQGKISLNGKEEENRKSTGLTPMALAAAMKAWTLTSCSIGVVASRS